MFVSLYHIKMFMTMPYNPHGNSQCNGFNHTLENLLKTLPKEQKVNWSLHVPSLVFAYNGMPHNVTGFQPYELMFGYKALTICYSWLGLANYNDRHFVNKCVRINDQHELLIAENWHALKQFKQSSNMSQVLF